MSITLNDFKNTLQDILRPNRFLLQFNAPTGVTANTGNIQYYVKTASLPSMKVGDVKIPWQGIETHYAGDFEYEDWKVTFYDDYAYEARSFVENWMQLIANPTTNIRTAQATYQQQFLAMQLGRDGETIATYTIIGQPTEIAAIDLSQESLSKPSEFEATFVMDYWTVTYGAGA